MRLQRGSGWTRYEAICATLKYLQDASILFLREFVILIAMIRRDISSFLFRILLFSGRHELLVLDGLTRAEYSKRGEPRNTTGVSLFVWDALAVNSDTADLMVLSRKLASSHGF